MIRTPDQGYCGRFAPSPTGPLHFGSLVTAVGSYLQARSQQGTWRLRIDDIDPQRDSTAAIAQIPAQLEALGLHWDGRVVYQSHHEARYRRALSTLLANQQAFHCGCTRREVAASPLTGPEGPLYPGTCHNGLPAGKIARSVRIKVDHTDTAFNDGAQGRVCRKLADTTGDFVIRRADGHIAYQLAAAVDDVDGGFTEVVRGADLLSSTLRQLWLHRCLDRHSPDYLHLPVATRNDGKKLSKQHMRLP